MAQFAAKINPIRRLSVISIKYAGVMELADVVDSKSTASDGVPVRVRPPAPSLNSLNFFTIKKTFGLFCYIEEFKNFHK